MTSVLYIKEMPKIKKAKSQKWRRNERFFLVFLALIGLSSMVFAVFPYFSWQLRVLPRLTAGVNQAPIPSGEVLSSGTVSNANVQVIKEADGFSYFSTDYQPTGSRPKEFYVSIPKLEIENATAKVDNLRFDRQLSHFPGSAIPGDVGNAFVTGHSVLPQFADAENYRKIFSKLDTLEIGDEVIVEVGDQKRTFIVQYAKVVDPRDLSVLAPISDSGRNLTLMTCVPPGTNIKRLVVITSLI